jgi:hypothetical protein
LAHGDWGIVMHTLTFICPDTGLPINSGIITTGRTFLLIQDKTVNFYCPLCQKMHGSKVCEACPEQPAFAHPRTAVVLLLKSA